MAELSNSASFDIEAGEFETGRWSPGQTYAFVIVSSVALWTLIGLALMAVL
jgi:hypothetical protein